LKYVIIMKLYNNLPMSNMQSEFESISIVVLNPILLITNNFCIDLESTRFATKSFTLNFHK